MGSKLHAVHPVRDSMECLRRIAPDSPANGDFAGSERFPYTSLVARTPARSMMKRDSMNPPADLKRGKGCATAAERAARD